jgi:hypothetical protein
MHYLVVSLMPGWFSFPQTEHRGFSVLLLYLNQFTYGPINYEILENGYPSELDYI